MITLSETLFEEIPTPCSGVGQTCSLRVPTLPLPTTGVGFFGQKRWVTLPGTGPTTLDGIYTATAPAAGEQTAASASTSAPPALGDAADDAARAPAGQGAPPCGCRCAGAPLAVTDRLDPEDPIDSRILGNPAGTEDIPEWWPQDDSGDAIPGMPSPNAIWTSSASTRSRSNGCSPAKPPPPWA
ncbi:hypothetical protein [Streptomyces violascens]|uniref:hypothetical protein n=1 Tax=Streptomyces violascens TaxID=67381 RepID=UPI0036962CB2